MRPFVILLFWWCAWGAGFGAPVHETGGGVPADAAELARRIAALAGAKIPDAQHEAARLALTSARIDAQAAGLDLEVERKRQRTLQREVARLRGRLSALPGDAPEAKDLRTRLAAKGAALEQSKRHLQTLERRRAETRGRLALARQWWRALDAAYAAQREIRHQESLEELERRLDREIARARQEVGEWRSRLEAAPEGSANRDQAQARLDLALERVQMLQTGLNTGRLRLQIQEIGQRPLNTAADVKQAMDDLGQLKQILGAWLSIDRRKLEVLRQRAVLLDKRRALGELDEAEYLLRRDRLTDLIQAYDGLVREQEALHDRVRREWQRLQAEYKQRLETGLATRQTLPTAARAWRGLGDEVLSLPRTLGRGLEALYAPFTQADPGRQVDHWLLTLVLWILWSGLVLTLRVRTRPVQAAMPGRFLARLRWFLVLLYRRLWPDLWVAGLLCVPYLVWGFGLQRFLLSFWFLWIWFGLRILLALGRLLLVAPSLPAELRRPDLYRLLRPLTWTAALLVFLLGLAWHGLVSDLLGRVAERALMVVMLPVVYLSLRLRRLFLERRQARGDRPFWLRLAAVVSMVIPLTLAVSALVGLGGYINLAWFLTEQVMILIGVILLWAGLRHLVLDATDAISRWLGIHSRRPQAWIKGLVEPLHYLVRLALALAMLRLAAGLYAGNSGIAFGDEIRAWLEHPLFHLGKTGISPLNIGAALLAIGLVIFVSIWLRRLTNDWLYQGIRDRGLRHSLSVFTQYAVLVIGFLVVLNLLGIDLTSITVFAGALGVGIGFGLQNVANNFVSGLILLVERPVRVQDWTSIGGTEGRVARIGMRSLTLRTWDNQDVIIPNADLISQPFTNWTLSDTLVRTLFSVGIRYQDDPHRGLEVVHEAVTLVPEVSLERPPRVLLENFAASSVDLRVEYYVDVEQFSRVEVKSKVMLAIWDALAEAGIGIPFPQQDVYIKELPAVAAFGPPREQGAGTGLENT